VALFVCADFAGGNYLINGSPAAATDVLVEDLTGWGSFDVNDSVVPGVGLTSGNLGMFGVFGPTIVAAVQADFTVIMDCVFDYSDFSILEIEPYDSPTFATIWDYFYGDSGAGVCTLEIDDYLNNLAQTIGILKANHPTAKIGFSSNHTTGVVSAAMTGETLITGTAIAGHRSPPRPAFTGIALGLQDSQTTHGNYIKMMAIYTPALSDAALAAAVAAPGDVCSTAAAPPAVTSPIRACMTRF